MINIFESMDEAKIRLSVEELELVENAEWILTKNRIIDKVQNLFGILAVKMKTELETISLPDEPLQTNPKISKGENYNGLPYVILDYPRLFSKENVFAIRTMFWWGNYFSVTLHLKGSYKDLFVERIRRNISSLSENEFYLSSSDKEWMHALDEKNYTPFGQTDTVNRESIFSKNVFLKISLKTNLSQWNDAEVLLINSFKRLLQLLGN
jgi:hypothetical protein